MGRRSGWIRLGLAVLALAVLALIAHFAGGNLRGLMAGMHGGGH